MSERDPIDDLFALARDTPPPPSGDFMARILADATAEQDRLNSVRPTPPKPASLWQSLVAALGGIGAVAGVGSAAVAGLVIGYVQPDAFFTLADSYGISASASDSLDLLPGYDSLLSVEPIE